MAPVSESGSEAHIPDELEEEEEDYEDDCEEYAEEYASDGAESSCSSSSSHSQPLRGSFPSIPTRSSAASSSSSSTSSSSSKSSSRASSPSDAGILTQLPGEDGASDPANLLAVQPADSAQDLLDGQPANAGPLAELERVDTLPTTAKAPATDATPEESPSRADDPVMASSSNSPTHAESAAALEPRTAMDLDLGSSAVNTITGSDKQATFPLGRYIITNPASVTTEIGRESDLVMWLDPSTSVVVTTVIRSTREHRLRAKIEEPAGWISICDLSGEMFWARPAALSFPQPSKMHEDEAAAATDCSKMNSERETDDQQQQQQQQQQEVVANTDDDADQGSQANAKGDCEAVAACLASLQTHSQPKAAVDAPGRYSLVRPASITAQIERASDLVAWLEAGVEIQVDEIVSHEEEERIRALISYPISGWISLAHLDESVRWAERLPDQPSCLPASSPATSSRAYPTENKRVSEAGNLPADEIEEDAESFAGDERSGEQGTGPHHPQLDSQLESQAVSQLHLQSSDQPAEPSEEASRESELAIGAGQDSEESMLHPESSSAQHLDLFGNEDHAEAPVETEAEAEAEAEEYRVKLPIPEQFLSPVAFDGTQVAGSLSPSASPKDKEVSEKDHFFSAMAELGNGNVAVAWKQIFCDREGPLGMAWADFSSGLDAMEYSGSKGGLWAELSGIDSLVELLTWDQLLDQTSARWIKSLGDWCRSRCGGLLATWELLGGSLEGPPLPSETLLQGFRDCGLFDTPDMPFGLTCEDEFRQLVLPVINLSGSDSILPEGLLFLERNTKLRRRLRLELEHARERAAELPAAYSGHRPRVPRCGGVNAIPGRSEASSLLTRAAHEGFSVEPSAHSGHPQRELPLRGKPPRKPERADRAAGGAVGGWRQRRPSLTPLLEESPSDCAVRSAPSSAPASPSAGSRPGPALMEQTLQPDEGWPDGQKSKSAQSSRPSAPPAPTTAPVPPGPLRKHPPPQLANGDYLNARPLPAALRRATSSSSVARRGASVAVLAPCSNRRPMQAFGSKAPLQNLPSLGPPPAVAPPPALPRLASMPELRSRSSAPPSSAGASVAPSHDAADAASSVALSAGRHRKQTKQVYGHKMESHLPEGQSHLQWHNPKQRAVRNKDDRHAKLPVVRGEDFLRRGACQDLFDRYCHSNE